jgi:hypothetical protein
MQPDEIQRLYQWLQGRVRLGDGEPVTILFDEPTADDLSAAGFEGEAVSRTLEAGWWPEMVTDIVETPDFAEPGETAEQILEYARDVVKEYIWKRLYA